MYSFNKWNSLGGTFSSGGCNINILYLLSTNKKGSTSKKINLYKKVGGIFFIFKKSIDFYLEIELWKSLQNKTVNHLSGWWAEVRTIREHSPKSNFMMCSLMLVSAFISFYLWPRPFLSKTSYWVYQHVKTHTLF